MSQRSSVPAGAEPRPHPQASAPQAQHGPAAVLQMRGIDKHFGRVQVLSQIDLDVRAGEILVDGTPADISVPADAEALGIRVIHQDRHLAPRLTVAEQFFLGSGSAPRFTGRGMYAEAERRLRDLVGLEVPARTLVDDLTVAEQQLLQIAQAISERPRVLVLDEPTAPLAAEQVERLFATIERLRADGVAMIYISHYLQEVQRIADRVVVLRNGGKVGDLSLRDRRTGSLDDIVELMVGHRVDEYASARQSAAKVLPDAPALLQIEQLRVDDRIESFSLALRPGEVVGVTGLVGSGVEELAAAISGLSPRDGSVHLDGRRIASPRQFVAAGGAHVPADRRRDGVLVTHTVDENLSFAGLGRVTGATGLISRGKERALGARIIERLGIRPARGSATVSTLSGGNQQKVAVGKWLAAEARVFVLDQPTAGVDIGSREQIYQEISALVGAGAAVLLISLDLEELLGLSDRVLVLYRGRVTAELPNDGLGAEQVLAFSSGAATVNEGYQI